MAVSGIMVGYRGVGIRRGKSVRGRSGEKKEKGITTMMEQGDG